MRKFALLLVVALALVSCSEPGGPSALEEDADRPVETSTSPADGKGSGKQDDKSDAGGAKKKGTKREMGGPGGGTDKGEGGGGGQDPYTEGPREDDHSSPLFTAPGDYVYQQSGYERFCGAATCEREDLPDRQSMKVTLEQRSSESAVVVAEARASGNRLMRTTTRFTRGVALVTKVYARFSYEGFTFENSYAPKPPVESLRFPMSDGQSWSGRWTDSTSGTYSFEVGEREELEVGGRVVQAFRVTYEMTFEGEFEGSSDGTVWVDPATRVVVASAGRLDLTSSFGRYVTEGRTRLLSGPRYR